MKKHTTSKKLLALLLALIMTVSLLPMSVFAAAVDVPETEPQVTEPVEEDVQEPEVTDVDTQAADGEVAVQASTEINYVTKTKDVPLKDGTFYRIVHIDCGRKYFSVDELKDIIDYAAASNYTHVELAFGNDGLRFLLDDMEVTASGVTYASSNVKSAIQAGNVAFYNAGTNELTEGEMDTIIAYAKTQGIGIIPMFDAPGHLQTVVRAMATLGVATNKYTTPTTSGSSVNYAIDFTDPASVNFVQALMQKYITYFAGKGCTMFNIAADECGFSSMNTTYTAYAKMVNSMAAMVQNAGMTALAFNDGIYHIGLSTSEEFDNNIAVCYWDASSDKYAPAATLASKGFKIINTNNHWYYVIGKENITGSSWGQYAYTCEYAKQQMSTTDSCLNIDGDNNQTIPAGCMAAIWCDYPSYSANWTNVESYIKTLAQYNTAYFVKKSTPVVKILADKTNLTVGDSTTLSMSDSSTAVWSVEPAGVIELISTNDISGTSVTAKALKAGKATVTATVGDNEYTQDITVTEVGAIEVTENRTITVTVGGTATDTIKNANYEGTYKTEDSSKATVVSAKYEKVDGEQKFTDATSVSSGSAYCIRNGQQYLTSTGSWTTDITQAAKWTYTTQSSYGSTYRYLTNGSNYLRYNNGWTTTTQQRNATSFTVSGAEFSYSSRRDTITLGTAGDVTITDPVDQTTITFEGVAEGTTYVTIGHVRYTINVTAEKLDGVDPLPIQLWITNIPIQVDTSAYEGGSTSGSYRSNNSWSEEKAWYVNVSASAAYGEKGVELSKVLPASMTRYENNITYWIKEQTDKAPMNLVLWSGRIHNKADSNIQKIWDVDYSNSGDEFTYVRYYGGAWAVSSDQSNWTVVTGANSTTSYNSCTQQLAAYYMIRTQVTSEVSTDVADWGYVSSDEDYSGQISKGYYVMLDFAVKYEGGTRNPNTFPQTDKTFVFHCNTGDNSGAVKQDSSGNYYRQLNNFRGMNTGDYEIYMVTVTMTEDDASDTLSSTTSYKYNGEEQIVWAIDQKTHDNCGLNDYQAITSGDTTYSGCDIGGDPYVRGVEVYNKHGALITYYIRAKATPDSLTVHYVNKKTGEEFYNYSIIVDKGVTFDPNFTQTEPNTTNLTGNTVVNSLGVTETITAKLEEISKIGAQYKYSKYTCVDTSRNDDGKDVYLYYEFDSTKTFVVDFGLPLVIKPSDITESLGKAKIEKMSVDDSLYATITTNLEEFSLTYTLTATIDGQDDINVTYYGTNPGTGKPDDASYTLSIIPASTVYYEDSFATFTGGAGAAAGATWTDDKDGSKTSANQLLEVLGDKKNLYGYDEAYKDCTTFSMGSAHKVTVTADMAKNWANDTDSAWPTATFTFKGTGFDVISLTDNTSGAIAVDVYRGTKADDNAYEKGYVVNNYYGYQYNKETKTWEVNKENGENALYQIPVIKCSGLTYGEYTVVITPAYDKLFDKTDNNAYSFWLDAIRVYDPMGENADYAKDGEGWPQYIKLRTELKKNTSDEKTTLFIDGADQAKVADYANYGPNNEVYLAKGQAISFKLSGSLENIATVQIGAKSPDGTEAKAKISVNNKEISSATEMYYDITTAAKSGEVVTIANNGAEDTILSLTNLKVTFADADKDKNVNLDVLSVEDTNTAVATVRALFAAPVEPEPEVFEPERFEASWNRSSVRAGEKATLTVKTSEDVAAITVDGVTIDTYRTRTQRTGWGWNAKKVTYREFTYTITASETADHAVMAVNAEGTTSETIHAVLTVRAAAQRPGAGGWLNKLFSSWF